MVAAKVARTKEGGRLPKMHRGPRRQALRIIYLTSSACCARGAWSLLADNRPVLSEGWRLVR